MTTLARTATPGSALARLAGPVASATVALSGVLLVAAVDPNQPGHYPLCPFRAFTGLDCPGCGSLRAVHALAHGDVVGAANDNLLAVLLLPIVVLGWAAWVRRSALGQPRGPRVVPAAVVYALLVLVVVFWVVRNLPGVGFLPSGPA